jgi:hypothetical protein
MTCKFYFTLLVIFCLGIALGLHAQNNLLPNADLETMEPNFWAPMNGGLGGATVSWATDEAYGGSRRSFKVEKPGTTTDGVGWESENNANLYWNNAAGNISYSLGFWAKTMGVNTSPANEDAMIGVLYQFYAGVNLIGESFVEVDQSSADVDWTEYTGVLLVTEEPDEVLITAYMGMDATGTVWFDNIGCGTDPWSMGVFNSDAEIQEGWLQWNASPGGFANVVDDPAAHSGTHSALLYEADTENDEMVFYSEPVPAQPNTWYAFSVWVKTDSINTDPAWYATNVTDQGLGDRLGVTFFFHKTPLIDAWDPTGGDQFYYVDQLYDTLTAWTYYVVVAQAPGDAAGVSMRARVNSSAYGYAWYDDFSIQEIEDIITIIEENPGPISKIIPDNFNLMQNYPNPFNPETIIEFKVPERGAVILDIYNALGQKIRSLVDDIRQAGTYRVFWDGTDDFGNRVATGIYLYQLRGQNVQITKKMILVK